MDLSDAFRLHIVRRLMIIARASALALPLANAGCTDEACLRWTVEDREAEAALQGGGTTTGGAMDGGVDDGGASAGSAGTGPEVVVCPSRDRARELLGSPSCTESIVEVKSEEGRYDSSAEICCYDVTTDSHPCAVKDSASMEKSEFRTARASSAPRSGSAAWDRPCVEERFP